MYALVSYLLFTIFISFVSFLRKHVAFFLMIIGCAILLSLFPSTEKDYDTYKQAFDNAYWMDSYPWFNTRTTLVAEPFYRWYNSAIGVLLPYGFPFFLSLNFLICVTITVFSFRTFNSSSYLYLFWLMFMPVIFLTIFYWSPRSSISFFFILTAFLALTRQKLIVGFFFIALGISTHSQYLLVSALLLGTFFLFKLAEKINFKSYKSLILIVGFFLYFLLNYIESYLIVIDSLLGNLPSADVATNKLHYFSKGGSKGFRVTGLLSIVIYPIMAFILVLRVEKGNRLYFMKKRYLDMFFVYYLFAVIVYGTVINLAFFENTHLAGRLGRFCDYVGMGIVIPSFFKIIFNENLAKFILLLLALVAPILYWRIYENVDWERLWAQIFLV